MKFRNKYDRKVVFTCHGNEIEEEYELQVTEKGIKEPVKVGEINVREEINSHRDSVDLNLLIARFNAGDTEALNRRAASYFDATELPKTLAEAYRSLKMVKMYLINFLRKSKRNLIMITVSFLIWSEQELLRMLFSLFQDLR